MSPTRRTVVIVSSHGAMLEKLVTEAGFDVVGRAEVAVNAEPLIGYHEPDVVVVENELVGMTGVEAMAGLHRASPSSQIVLIVADDWSPPNRGDVGAYAVVTRSRLSELGTELCSLDAWLSDLAADPGAVSERRTGRDRRVEQDWTKVGWERRKGARRAGT